MKSTILSAKNEFTHSVVSNVSCSLISSGEEVTRPIDVVDWRRLRLFFKMSLVGSSATSTINGLFFAGICSNSRSFTNTNQQCCIGILNDNHTTPTIPNQAFFVSQSSNQTSPANVIWGWDWLQERASVVTGSRNGGSGTTTWYVPRYETQWSSSYHFFSQSGNPWLPMGIEIIKPNTSPATNNWTLNTTYFSTQSIVVTNIPKGTYLEGLQTYLFSAEGAVVWNTEHTELGFPAYSAQVLNATIPGFNESVYGSLDTVNFFWSCSDSSVKLAIRDVVIVVPFGDL